MVTWTPVRRDSKFAQSAEADAFLKAIRTDVAPGWQGSWSIVPDVRGDVQATRSGPAGLLAVDLLGDFRQEKAGRLIATGTFSSRARRNNTWQRTHLLSLDLDDGSDPAALVRAYEGHGMILHGSWNDWRDKDGKAHSRYRAYLFLSVPIDDRGDYLLFWRWNEAHCRKNGIVMDPSTKDPNRIMYTLRDGAEHPPVKHGHPSQWIACVPGHALDLDALPAGQDEAGLALTTSLRDLRDEASRAEEHARAAAQRAMAQAAKFTRSDLSSAAQRRFAAGVSKLVSSRTPGAGRNTGVFAAGAMLGSYVASGLISDADWGKSIITNAAKESGLTRDVDRQLENGFRLGLSRPLALDAGR